MKVIRANGRRLDCEECNRKMVPEVIRFEIDLGGYTCGYDVCPECLMEALDDLTNPSNANLKEA